MGALIKTKVDYNRLIFCCVGVITQQLWTVFLYTVNIAFIQAHKSRS